MTLRSIVHPGREVKRKTPHPPPRAGVCGVPPVARADRHPARYGTSQFVRAGGVKVKYVSSKS